MKILVTIHPFGTADGTVHRLLQNFNVFYNDKGRKYQQAELKNLLSAINPDIIIAGTEKYTAENLDLCPNLKMISRAGVGIDGIDLKECQKRGIAITYTPAACTDAVAELTIGQMVNALRNTQYVSRTLDRYIGSSISQSIVGVFGCGRIGKAVIKRLHGFNPLEILVNDFVLDKITGLENCKAALKDEILKTADIITFHIPLVEPAVLPKYDNHDFITSCDLNKCKPSAIIINTSRGGIVNEKDLVEWLKCNPGAKAVIDTFEVEPYEGELLALQNAFVTPHLGSCTKDARINMERGAVEEVLNFIYNKKFINCIVGKDAAIVQLDNKLSSEKIKITVIGAGYVGLVSGACFANFGYEVVCADKDEHKISQLNSGQVPFFEPGLTELIFRNQQAGFLKFTTSLREAVKNSNIIFICVGTPAKQNGQADISQVCEVANELGKELDHHAVIAIKSTVPAGTTIKIRDILAQYHSHCDVASCPEFLREGSAINDFMNPDRIVIGTNSNMARNLLLRVHEPFNCQKILTNPASAEMIKYSSNAFLATKISFINEIANICENVSADIEQVAEGIGLDKRIGKAFLKAGIGYGGSCFPKDIRALHHIAGQVGYPFQLLKAVVEVNNQQRWLFYKKIRDAVGCLKNKVIGIWGLAFKPNTDDIRESIAIELIEKFLEDGALIKAYDPQAMQNARKIFGDKIQFCLKAEEVTDNADCLALLTDWDEFKRANFKKIKDRMKCPLIVDGRNALDSRLIKECGLKYHSIGRN